MRNFLPRRHEDTKKKLAIIELHIYKITMKKDMDPIEFRDSFLRACSFNLQRSEAQAKDLYQLTSCRANHFVRVNNIQERSLKRLDALWNDHDANPNEKNKDRIRIAYVNQVTVMYVWKTALELLSTVSESDLPKPDTLTL